MEAGPADVGDGGSQRDDDLRHDMERVREALPGLGEPVSLRVFAESPSSGRTLAELNLRGVTGATVLAILRHGEQVLVPVRSRAAAGRRRARRCRLRGIDSRGARASRTSEPNALTPS